ncbi:lysozyme [Mesorhizobium sp. BR1-1-7]|uniref:lysozyme n=1 Tax=Mesorhizobium sp. BR1-1-7 TaxID=2876647 RepID=UPI001CC9ECA9|nr:lysozyme [Mesorhizobium sp. BR1-1-7]MBZ9922270.1 lysozyme [Mesorhizobium sp. BR1-1-7]
MRSRLIGALGAMTVAGSLAVQTVGGYEGLKLYAYRDVIGVWTACYGETKGIKPGMKFSKATCDNMLVSSLVEHEQGMRRCLNDPDGIPIEIYIAELSLTYNIGPGPGKSGREGFCGSSLPAKTNAKQWRAVCDTLPAFNKAGGRINKGLVNRRATERALCLRGL